MYCPIPSKVPNFSTSQGRDTNVDVFGSTLVTEQASVNVLNEWKADR